MKNISEKIYAYKKIKKKKKKKKHLILKLHGSDQLLAENLINEDIYLRTEHRNRDGKSFLIKYC